MDQYTQPHPETSVLLTIDTQNDFTLPGAPAAIEGTAQAVPQMQRLVEAFRSADAFEKFGIKSISLGATK